MKVIVYTRPDGGLSVRRPALGARLALFVTLKDGSRIPSAGPVTPRPVDQFLRQWPVAGATAEWAESEDQFLQRIRAKDVPANATDVQIVDEAAIPSDRAFRNAWKAAGAAVAVDMPRARQIHRDRLREIRKPKLQALDVAWMRALAAKDEAAALEAEAKRQQLRDVTKDALIDAAATPDELKAAIPAVLGEST